MEFVAVTGPEFQKKTPGGALKEVPTDGGGVLLSYTSHSLPFRRKSEYGAVEFDQIVTHEKGKGPSSNGGSTATVVFRAGTET